MASVPLLMKRLFVSWSRPFVSVKKRGVHHLRLAPRVWAAMALASNVVVTKDGGVFRSAQNAEAIRVALTKLHDTGARHKS